jgi:chromate transporter
MISPLIGLFLKLSAFSLLAFGGINALLPVLLKLAVEQEHWIDAQTFSDFFAIAQAAPGPNGLIVALIGWKVSGILGAFIATLAICWPSSIMIFFLQRYLNNMQDLRIQRTIQFAAGSLAVGLVLSSSWQIALQIDQSIAAFALTAAAVAITLFTRWHPLYLIAFGGLLGVMGFI